QLRVPPLRERPGDLAALTLAFVRRHQHIYPHVTAVAPELIEVLRAPHFPGNIRELEHALHRIVFGQPTRHRLSRTHWTLQAGAAVPPGDRDLLLEAAQRLWMAIAEHGLPYSVAFRRLERKVLETALLVQGQTRRDMARRLSTSERTLYHKLRTHRLSRS